MRERATFIRPGGKFIERWTSGRFQKPRSSRMTAWSWANTTKAPSPNAWPVTAAAVGTPSNISRCTREKQEST